MTNNNIKSALLKTLLTAALLSATACGSKPASAPAASSSGTSTPSAPVEVETYAEQTNNGVAAITEGWAAVAAAVDEATALLADVDGAEDKLAVCTEAAAKFAEAEAALNDVSTVCNSNMQFMTLKNKLVKVQMYLPKEVGGEDDEAVQAFLYKVATFSDYFTGTLDVLAELGA